ncbi:MAG TPA: amidohydrolase family protein [Prolixibacteraceae bacterium]|nr:amidohydrolase family protein [Prolixibacteraceae bacterium]
MIIDSHHHLWKYDPVQYDWIDDSMKKIRADFLADDLKLTIQEANVDGVISVQARQSVEETDWLIGMANQNNFIKGVVGWLPLIKKDIGGYLEKYAEEKLLKGVRHVIQGEPDPEFMLRKDFNHGITLLRKYSLVYDILIVERQLPNTIRFVDQHPDQVFVLDHIAKPLIGCNELSPWKENILELARRENVNCKISGMVTEADYQNWTSLQLHPYFEVILEAFGPDRLLFGSDWPVCLVATTYKNWMELVQKNITSLSETEQLKIMGGNATRLYQL